MVGQEFDVFLCHHSEDKGDVLELGKNLLKRDVRPSSKSKYTGI